MENTLRFADIVEAAQNLTLEEQESLAEVVANLISERKRAKLLREIQKARKEIKQGKYRHIKVSELDKYFAPEKVLQD